MFAKNLRSARPMSMLCVASLVALTLAGCAPDQAPSNDPAPMETAPQAQSDPADDAPSSDTAPPVETAPPSDAEPTEPPSEPTPEPTVNADPPEAVAQEETCDWDTPKLEGSGQAPAGQDGDLASVLVGSWQHTHTDEGAGFEAVANDHRYVFPAPERMLYCQHVPGATDYADQAADVTLNGTAIELPGGQYAYTVTAWDADTMVWDNPVGGGYVYLLERRS